MIILIVIIIIIGSADSHLDSSTSLWTNKIKLQTKTNHVRRTWVELLN